MQTNYQNFLIRDWQPGDRTAAAEVIRTVLAEYGIGCEPEGADWDIVQIEDAYWQTKGEFWVVEKDHKIVGTAGFYPVTRGTQAVEIRKMYLLPEARGIGLGKFLLKSLEEAIASQGYQMIWVETMTILKEAVSLYEKNGYQPSTGVETKRCDRIYLKQLTPSPSNAQPLHRN